MAMRISYRVARQIADHAEAEAPNEACGLLAGDGATIDRAIPLRNSAAMRETRYRFAPAEQLAALKSIDADSLNWIGIYHSHPRSAPIPSPADVNEALDPKLLHLIVSLKDARPALKLWRIEDQSVTPVDLRFDTDASHEESSQLTKRQRAAIVAAGIASLLLLFAISLSLLPPAPQLSPVP